MSEQRAIRHFRQRESVPNAAATREGSALRWLVGGLTLAAAAALVPFWAPLLLAAWGAIIAGPLQQRLAGSLRRPRLAAAVLTALLVLVILLPITVATLSLSGSAITLWQHLSESKSGAEALQALSRGDAGGFELAQLDPQHVLGLVRRH